MRNKDCFAYGTSLRCRILTEVVCKNGAYNFNNNVYALNSCDHNFFLDFDATTYEPYDEDSHLTTLKAWSILQILQRHICKSVKRT